jgi:hypothetical protein
MSTATPVNDPAFMKECATCASLITLAVHLRVSLGASRDLEAYEISEEFLGL